MKNTQFQYYSCLLLLFVFVSLKAEVPSFARFDKLTQDDGLSSNRVHCILQEKSGWMWFGTSLGLDRYDGYQFTKFRNGITGIGSLRGELVRHIFEDKNNHIWVGTELGGLNLFNRDEERFSHFLFEDQSIDTIFCVNNITADKDNRIWIGTNLGLAYLDDNSFLQLMSITALKEAGNPEILKIFIDNKGVFWLGTVAGLFVYDPAYNKGKRIPLPDTSRPYDEIDSFCFDSENTLWIGTYNSGVYTTNPKTQIVNKVNNWVKFDRSETIRAIQEDHNGLIWFGTRGGLVVFDKTSQTYTSFLRDEDESLTLSLNSVLSLCVDSKGDLWVGTRGGINYRNNEKQAFRYLKAAKNDNRFLNNADTYCFLMQGDNLLIGTESGGINIYNMITHRFRYITSKEGLSSDCIKSFVRDGNDILVGTYQGGITVMDASDYRVKYHLKHQDRNPSSLKDNIVWWLFKDSKEQIWVATNKGVQIYDPKNRTFQDTGLLSGRSCNWIKEDSDGHIWLGGGDDLIIYDPEKKQSIIYNERTRDFIPALEKNRYWIATRGHGLVLYEKGRGVITSYTETDGLSNNHILSLIRAYSNQIWMSTLNGLTLFNEETRQFTTFDVQDGLQDNLFNYGAALQIKSDELIFGGVNGVNIFDVDEVRRNSFIPPVAFTGLKIFNQPVGIGKILDKSISRAKTINLNYKQNVFSIEFAALSYANSVKNKYRYKLEGFDRDWIDAGTSNSATYTNLDAGKYTFMVKGSNSNDVWNDQGASIEIIIKPPFWKTWWFRLIMGIIISSILVYLGNFYLKRAKLKNELIFEKTKARKLHEIENMKLRFFTNISHEIRTPLTLILGPLNQVIENGSVDGDSKGKLQLVKRNADQLLKLINQLLDFRKLEAGKYNINYAKGDIVFFINSIVESFQGMALEKGIELNFKPEKESFITWFDQDKVQKILNNLLSNALKFTDKPGYVNVFFGVKDNITTDSQEKNSYYTFAIEDSGKGIPQKNLRSIFSRFERGNNVQESTGSGIGLSITHEFIKLMNGEIDVDSLEGKGTTFTVKMPLLSDADIDINTVNQPEEKANASERNDMSKKIILIAEDNNDVREYVASNFRAEYKVLEATNGKDAFDLAIRYIPDIILSDLLMPVMGGDVFCKKIKKDEKTSHIPFLLLTAVSSKETEKEAFKTGADDYITKPFDMNILKLKVDNLLSLRNSLREKYKNDFITQPQSVTLVSPDEKFMKKAIDIIEKNIDDPDFDIESFASEVGVSRMQLYRKMEALTNMTVKEFIRDIRMKRAAQLLEQNKISVSEIVYQVGFRDLAYFRKCFRELYGMSPSEYAAKFK